MELLASMADNGGGGRVVVLYLPQKKLEHRFLSRLEEGIKIVYHWERRFFLEWQFSETWSISPHPSYSLPRVDGRHVAY